MVSLQGNTATFRFLRPHARSVHLVGEFNGWQKSEANRLSKLENGLWSAHFSIDKGKYRYKYLVDDSWINDPHNPQVETNEFGTVDSVLHV